MIPPRVPTPLCRPQTVLRLLQISPKTPLPLETIVLRLHLLKETIPAHLHHRRNQHRLPRMRRVHPKRAVLRALLRRKTLPKKEEMIPALPAPQIRQVLLRRAIQKNRPQPAILPPAILKNPLRNLTHQPAILRKANQWPKMEILPTKKALLKSPTQSLKTVRLLHLAAKNQVQSQTRKIRLRPLSRSPSLQLLVS